MAKRYEEIRVVPFQTIPTTSNYSVDEINAFIAGGFWEILKIVSQRTLNAQGSDVILLVAVIGRVRIG